MLQSFSGVGNVLIKRAGRVRWIHDSYDHGNRNGAYSDTHQHHSIQPLHMFTTRYDTRWAVLPWEPYRDPSACSDSAAQMAQAYDGGGKSDWFLLSENELDILSTYVRNSSLSSSYAFDDEFYWSSTQEKNTEGRSAPSRKVNSGQDYVMRAWISNSVRPVRAF